MNFLLFSLCQPNTRIALDTSIFPSVYIKFLLQHFPSRWRSSSWDKKLKNVRKNAVYYVHANIDLYYVMIISLKNAPNVKWTPLSLESLSACSKILAQQHVNTYGTHDSHLQPSNFTTNLCFSEEQLLFPTLTECLSGSLFWYTNCGNYFHLFGANCHLNLSHSYS